MKILHVNEHLAWAGGVETYLLSLIPELERQDHAQSVVFAKGQPDLVNDAHRLADLSFGDRAAEQRANARMAGIIGETEPDAVHLHQVYNVGAIRACLDRVPLIVHAHDYRYACPASTFYYRRTREECQRTSGPACFGVTVRKHCLSPRPAYALNYYRRVRWFRRHGHRVAAVIAPSESAAGRYLAAGFDAKKIHVLPYFCTLPASDEPRALPPAPTILFIGRIRPNKGVDTFVEAFGRLPDTTRAVMIGDFTEAARRAVAARAARLACRDRLELRDWVERAQIRQAFAQATVLVFPSLWPETLGIVGIEALACGVPAVASDIGGVREWLIPGKTGYLAEPGNVADFAEKIEKLLFDPAMNREFGAHGQRLVRDRFAPAEHVRRLLDIYRSSSETHPVNRAGAAH